MSVQMTEAKRAYDQWIETMKIWRESRKTSYSINLFGLSGDPVEPHLFQWMDRLKAAVNNKYTFYFYQRLEAAAPSPQLFAEKQQSLTVNYAAK
jgi:hypothetical protein